jgi:putative chitinase
MTPEQLALVVPRLKRPRLMELLPHLVAAMAEFDISTPQRQAAFLGQVAHETGELRWMKEFEGESKRYAPFYGRGALMLTWLRNYVDCGLALGADLVGSPELAATDAYAFRTAGWFWRKNRLNQLADLGDYLLITKRINGGLTAYPERCAYHEAAKVALGC